MTRNARPNEVASRLESAADLLETEGWSSGRNQTGRTIFDAIYDSCRSPFVTDNVMSTLSVQHEKDYGSGSVIRWNRSQTDRRKVTRLLRRTARNLRNGDLKVVPHFGYRLLTYNY